VLPRWLQEQGAEVVIAGGMGMRAQQLFAKYGMKVIVGAPPEDAESVALSYVRGTLQLGENICDH
jgi:predicted Fe-Mo cluster-binding NifX family protein